VVGVRECAGMPVNDVAKIDDSVRVAQRQQKKSEVCIHSIRLKLLKRVVIKSPLSPNSPFFYAE
jgi:hypothetical protein